MAFNIMFQSWLLCFSLVLVLHSFSTPTCHCQLTTSNSPPRNIETFYPNETLAPVPEPQQPPNPHQPSPPTQNHAPPTTTTSSSSNGKIAKAVAGTAASTIVVCGLIFILVQRCLRARRRKENTNTASGGDGRVVPQGNVFERVDGNVRGLIVDEDGLDVIYWRTLEGKNSKEDLQKEVLTSPKNTEKEDDYDDGEGVHDANQVKKSKSIQEIPLLRGKSSTSHLNLPPEEDEPYRISRIPLPPASSAGVVIKDVQKPDSPTQPSTPPPPASPASTPSSISFSAVPKERSSAAAPPPPPPQIMPVAPPPAPPPIPARKNPTPPPPPPHPPPSSKPQPGPIEMQAIKQRNSSVKGMPEASNDQVKLKPLHWDKVNANADHSMVWDKVDRGSFRVDQDLMEALFGYVATNRRSPKGKSHSAIPGKDASAPPAKAFLLDPRKSQNIAIVLKSLAVSQGEILDALKDGKGLNADTLEKLCRVSPTEEEQSLIQDFTGDPARLAAAESFLFHILKAVPSAFKRLNAMLFRLTYDSEIQEIKESMQTIELGCKELKSKGLFVKLLEAVLKAGNRMNAGTARGNVQAFNLNSLRKLSDVKSINGKTTLLHFVVEEVVRSEGKRVAVALNRNGSLSRSSSRSSSTNSNGNYENNVASSEQIEREYITLGLPIVGGISSEFSNVKKAALVDFNNLISSISALSTRLVEIQKVVSLCGNGEGGYFVREMEHFLGNAEEELRLVKDKKASVLQLIKKTTQYYQGGASKDTAEENLQLFVIVKDFLGMVDQTCIEIARDMQQKKIPKPVSG